MKPSCSRVRILAGVTVSAMLLLGVARVMDVEHVSGVLTSKASDMIAVAVDDETRTYTVSGITMVSLNGEPAGLDDLHSGDSVTIAAQAPSEDGMQVAMRVDAVRDGA